MIDQFIVWLWKHSKKIMLYTLWLTLLIILSAYFYMQITESNKTLLIQGKTSNGHYQIEEKCDSCHAVNNPGTLGKVKQNNCLNCHKEKKRSNTKSNSHRAKLFAADDKLEQRKLIQADQCITCHEEHQLGNNGTTQPDDFCVLCHKDITQERESHKDFAFDNCHQCHNFHDNSANYSESFISKHLEPEADHFENSLIPPVQFPRRFKKKHISAALSWEQQDSPKIVNAAIAKDWNGSSHALAGVNCQNCHTDKNKQWVEKPNHKNCVSCHKMQTKGFLSGKHGMRLKQQLSSMSTEQARLPMTSGNKILNCVSCHKDHQFKAKSAAVASCLNCHDDKHSRAYKKTKHFQLWNNNDERGVSCASCHLPKIVKGKKKNKSVLTQHNQNHNLRPTQKMAKTVCINCHGLGFSIDALQSQSLIDNNFASSPTHHIPLIELWNTYNSKDKTTY